MTKFYYRERLTMIVDQFSVIEAATPEAAEEQFEEGLGKHLGHSFVREIDHDGVTTELSTSPPASIEYDAGPDRVVVFIEGGVVTNVEGNAPLQYHVVDLDELSDTGDATEEEATAEAMKWLVEAPPRKWPADPNQVEVAVVCEDGKVVDVYSKHPVDYEVFDYNELEAHGKTREEATAIVMKHLERYNPVPMRPAAEPSQPPQPTMVWACPDCKSMQVQSQMWVCSNTLEVLDDTERYAWCNACENDGEDGEKKNLDLIPIEQTREHIDEMAVKVARMGWDVEVQEGGEA